MRWIGRFFLVIALIFLALDILEAGPMVPATGGTPPATGGDATGATTGGETPATGGDVAGTDTAGTDTAGADTAGGDATTGGDATADKTPPATGDAAKTPPMTSGPNRIMLHTLGERWFEYHPDSYLQVSPAVSRHVSPWLDDAIVQPLMLQPGFLIFFFLWLLFSFFSWLIGRARYDDY